MNFGTRTNTGEVVNAARLLYTVDCEEHVLMSNPKEAARHLLASISESLNVGPDEVARVAGQFITPGGNQAYRVRLNGRTVYVTVPED